MEWTGIGEKMTFSAPWVAVIFTILIQLVGTVWWASRMNTLLSILREDFKIIMAEMMVVKTSFVSKEDNARELAIAEKEHQALWKRIDELREIAKTA